MVVFSSRRRRQRETREKGRERRVQSASISHDRQRERSRGKRTTSGDSEDDKREDEGTKRRRTSDDVHDGVFKIEKATTVWREKAQSWNISNLWGNRRSISVTKTRHERSRVVVAVRACLTARSTTRLRPRTRTTTRVVLVQE